MPALEQLATYLDVTLNIAAIPDYPNAVNGVQLANIGDIHHVATAVDFSTETVAGAIDASAKLLVAAGADVNGKQEKGWMPLHAAAKNGDLSMVKVLLEAGAAPVYAVDVGHGQLLGSLRQDPRVVNLEATNLSQLDMVRIPEPIELITLDLSYLSLASGVRYLPKVQLARGATLLALVKPMFELGLAQPPSDDAMLEEARRLAERGIREAGWRVAGSIRSPVKGARGAIEFWVHATRPAL